MGPYLEVAERLHDVCVQSLNGFLPIPSEPSDQELDLGLVDTDPVSLTSLQQRLHVLHKRYDPSEIGGEDLGRERVRGEEGEGRGRGERERGEGEGRGRGERERGEGRGRGEREGESILLQRTPGSWRVEGS